VAFGFQSPAPVTLKRTFKQGTVETFVQTVQNESESSPVPMDFTMTSELKRTLTKVDDKGAEFKAETVKIKMEPDPGTELPKPTMTGHIDSYGVITDMKAVTANAPAGYSDMMSAFTQGKNPDVVSLPAKPVKPGDTWTFKPGFTETLNAEGEYVFTFKGEKELEGKTYWYITGTGSFKLKGKDGGVTTDPATIMASMKGTLEFTIEAYLDKADCSPVMSVVKGTTSLTMASMGVEVSTRSTVTQKRV
jgi:L,D-peptidoglycan transpeptidase YkuD (ErfK/YbiS/YcfS/YnhG family)